MYRKARFFPVLAAALVLASLLSACGSGSTAAAQSAAVSSSMAYTSEAYSEYDEAYDMAAEAPMEGEMAATALASDAQAASDTQASLPAGRKIVRHSSLELETQEFDSALSQIRASIAQQGGYIENESVDGTSLYHSEYYTRSAQITARIPTEKLDTVLSEVGSFCNVRSRSENTDDITERYFDAQAHLKTLNIQEERLRAILEKAEKLEDVITLESALSEVRYEIESLTASLRRMDSQVMYSYLNISLNEVAAYTEQRMEPKTFGEEIAESFSYSMARVKNSAKSLLLAFIEVAPVLLLNLLVLLVIVLVLMKVARLFLKLVNSRQRRIVEKASHLMGKKTQGMDKPHQEVGSAWSPGEPLQETPEEKDRQDTP